MTFSFACHNCGHVNHAEFAWAGRTIHCAGCGSKIVVPAPSEPALGSNSGHGEPALTSLAAFKFKCQACGRKYAAKPELIGKKIRCGGCGTRVVVPSHPLGATVAQLTNRVDSVVTATKSRPPSRPSADRVSSRAREDDQELSEDDEVIDHAPTPHDSALPLEPPKLPSKWRIKGPGGRDEVDTVLPSRSEAIAELEGTLAKKLEEEKEKERKKVRKKKKKRSTGGLEAKDVVNMLGAVVVAIIVLGGLSYGYPGLRFPIGGMMSVCGFILVILGTFGIGKVAGEEGFHFKILCRFMPLYKWYYIYTRWDAMKDHFAFYAVGMMLLWPGGLLLKLSPEYTKSAEFRQQSRANPDRKAQGQRGIPSPAPRQEPVSSVGGDESP